MPSFLPLINLAYHLVLYSHYNLCNWLANDLQVCGAGRKPLTYVEGASPGNGKFGREATDLCPQQVVRVIEKLRGRLG